ncbi:MAG TPA: sporadically distributed protein, TIGR04141 family [Smithella sp.]|jgi:uncharacterized protein (TIGR04141 family)|nr:sporadically distributed protein, TIGR04141 family [Smithella sp.]
MSKTHPFSIYLLKEGFDAANSLKAGHGLKDSFDADNIPEGASIFILDSIPKEPWWKNYFGVKGNLKQTIKGAILFLNVKERHFAITFGHTHHHLKDECYEYDFGLRVTLNSLDPDKLKSTDTLEPEKAKRQRIQSPVDSDLTYFDFDRDSSIIKTLTGKVKNEYKNIFKHATGASSLRIGLSVEPDKLNELCQNTLDIYNKEDFKAAFPDIQNIIPIKDPEIIKQLDFLLIQAFKNNSIDLVLTIPEIVNYQDSLSITFTGVGQSLMYEDVYISYYRDYLLSHEYKADDFSIDILKSHQLNICNDDGSTKEKFSIYKSLLYDTSLDSCCYHFCEGNWYQIEKSYIDKLKRYLDPYFENTNLIDFNHNSERAYNNAIASNDSKYICLDCTNISPVGQRQVEPCDLYKVEDGIAIYSHVKLSTRSASLSHLFNQGVNSIELIKVEDSTKEKMINLVKENLNGNSAKDYIKSIEDDISKVIYIIITHKDENNKSDNLPLFSRISLMRSIKSLKLMSVKAAVCFVKDLSPKKDGRKKERSKKEQANA